MNQLIQAIKKIAGNRAKTLVPVIIMSCVDSILHMGMFGIMIGTMIELITGTFTLDHLMLYSIILIALFAARAIISAISYTQTQYKGAEITADLRLRLGNHIRKVNLGYFNQNSICLLYTSILVFMYLPIAALIIFSFNGSKSMAKWTGFSLHWYEQLFSDPTIAEAIWVTVSIAIIAAVAATLIGTLAAIGMDLSLIHI